MNSTELKTQILVRGGWSTSVSVTEANLNELIDRAHKFCAGFHKWPDTEGRQSTTFASLVTNEDGILVGEYPEGWKTDSIRLLTIGGKRVNKKDYYKFRSFLEDNSTDTERMFSDYFRLYYINPRIDISGTVSVWGQYTPASLGGETGTTVFDGGNTEGDEAIIEMTMSYVYKRLGELQKAQVHEQGSRNIMKELWKRILDEQYQYQTVNDDGMWKRFDVLEGGYREDIYKRDQLN